MKKQKKDYVCRSIYKNKGTNMKKEVNKIWIEYIQSRVNARQYL